MIAWPLLLPTASLPGLAASWPLRNQAWASVMCRRHHSRKIRYPGGRLMQREWPDDVSGGRRGRRERHLQTECHLHMESRLHMEFISTGIGSACSSRYRVRCAGGTLETQSNLLPLLRLITLGTSESWSSTQINCQTQDSSQYTRDLP